MTVLSPGDFGYTYGITPKESRYAYPEMQRVLQTYLERMSGEQVKVRILPPRYGGSEGVVWVEPRGETAYWRIDINIDGLSTSKVMRLASSMLFTMNKGMIASVTKRMTDVRVQQIANAIEKARTEWLGDMWFNSDMFNETRVERLSMAINQNASQEPDDVRNAIRKIIYNVPGSLANPIIQGAMDRFGPEIKAAVRSLDQAVPLNLAVDIADYLNWRENARKQGGQPGDVVVPGGEDGESGQGGQGGQGVEPSDRKPYQDKDKGPGSDTGRSQVVAQGGGGEHSLTHQPTVQQQAPAEAEFESETFDNRKRIKSNIKRTITRRKNKAGPTQTPGEKRIKRMQSRVQGVYHPPTQRMVERATGAVAFDNSAHSVEILEIGGTPVDLDEYTKLTLGTYVGNRPPVGQLRKRGRVSPMDAWKLSVKGDTRIFRRPPLMQGHVSILVDISGSMGCWCNDCVTRYPDDMSAYLAWQVTALLGQLHPTAETFAYAGGRKASSKIIPLNAGEQPAGCARADSLSGGTPTCTAMLYFKDHLMSRPSGTTAIIVTDGGPDPCYGHGMSHVDYIGHEMIAQGMKFGTVFIGGGRYLTLPAEVSVNVTTLAEISNIQPLLEILDR